MSRKLLATTMLLSSIAYGVSNAQSAGSAPSVGTASIRGNMRLDGSQVAGDSTLFEGSTVETGQASAVLHLSGNSTIEMAAGSRGIVHENYVTLEQGAIDLKPTCGFVAESNGVRVTPSTSNAHGVLSVNNSNATVSSKSGEFLVTDPHGHLLGRVGSGKSSSFSAGQLHEASSETYVGSVETVDGHRLLTPLAPDNGTTYEIHNHNNVKETSSKLAQIDASNDAKHSSNLAQVKSVISTEKEAGMCAPAKGFPYHWVLAGAAVAAGSAIGFASASGGSSSGVSVTNQPVPPASR